MITSVKCACPVDGDVLLPPESFYLATCPLQMQRSFYMFRCPKCNELIVRQAGIDVRTALQQAGVRPKRFPQEALEKRPAGPALDDNDVLDLMLDLRDLPEVPELQP